MWVEDIRLGNEYQRKFISLITYDSVTVAHGNFKPYDIAVMRGTERTLYEIKADRKTVTTGNIVIEFACNNKPSGITSTVADNWIYFAVGMGQFYCIPTEDIKQAIEDTKYTRIIKGGDRLKSQMYVFPATVFQDYRQFYDERAP